MAQINAFEAAARHLSFSAAAKELNVQQPAISRQVAALESALDTPLFIRSKPRLTLTEEGEKLASSVSRGFDSIRADLDDIRDRQKESRIVVSAAIGFTSLYLLPRLADFQVSHPDIKVQIVTRDQNPDYDLNRCDAVVVFGEQGVPGLNSMRVFPERMVAICHPDHLNSSTPLSLDELAHQRLLHMSGPAHSDDWNRYFSGSGQHVSRPATHDRFLSYMVYLRAIQNGLGIGIGWRPMIDEFLSNGSLVQACKHEPETNRGYFCSATKTGAAIAEVDLFMTWLSGST
nr:LysR substrate-binding domain-containing protein [Ruegeria sp. Ofav3-42]